MSLTSAARTSADVAVVFALGVVYVAALTALTLAHGARRLGTRLQAVVSRSHQGGSGRRESSVAVDREK